MSHRIVDHDSDAPFVVTEQKKVRTDFKTLGVIFAAVIAGTLFYASVNAQLTEHTSQISDIKADVHTAARENRQEREESIRFRQELTTKIDYLVQGRRGNPPPAGTSSGQP